MSAQGSLSHHQLGNYLFTKEHIEGGGLWDDDEAQTSYKMYRNPNAEEEAEEPGWAPARDVGTLVVSHYPPEKPLPNRWDVSTRQERVPTPEEEHEETKFKGWNDRFARRDEVHLWTVAKTSRVMAPTLLALGQRQAKESTGRDLLPSDDLSVHSQRVVDRFKEAGKVSEAHETANRNNITFLPPLPVSPPGGLEGLHSAMTAARERFKPSVAMEEPIPRTEVEAAKAEGREMIRSLRPRGVKATIPRRS